MQSGDKIGGARHAPERAWVEVEAQYLDLLPAYPGASEVPVARVPSPPALNPEMSKPRALRLMALGYRAAIAHDYGEPSRVLGEVEGKDPRAVLRSKHSPALVQALPLMMEYRVAPASWSLFSIMVWKTYVMAGQGATWDAMPSRIRRPRSGTPPPPSWVFSVKRIENRSEWFGWHEANCRGGRLKISQAHKALIKKYETLRRALLSERSIDAERVRALVAEHLPAVEYERLRAKAKAEADYEQDRLDAAAEKGAWLW